MAGMTKAMKQYPLPQTLREWRLFFEYLKNRMLELGIGAMGRTAPNPPVAAVLVVVDKKSQNITLICGATEDYGKRHAEIVVLDLYDCWKKENPLGKAQSVRLFVSLEPCTHFGKTPPCCTRILEYPEIKKIFAQNKDPHLQISASQVCRQKKVRVIFNPENDLAKTISPLDGFLHRIRHNRSRLHLKIAISRDYCMGIRGQRLLISTQQLSTITMRLRCRMDAVFVASGTILADMPALDFRWSPHFDQLVKTDLEPKPQYDFFKAFLDDNLASVQENTSSFQPSRQFLIGSYDPLYLDFFHKQEKITRATGLSPVYYMYRYHLSSWHGQNKRFKILGANQVNLWSDLQSEWSKSFNNVMIEPGDHTLLSLVQKGLKKGDLIWVLNSDKTSDQLINDAGHLHVHDTDKIMLPNTIFSPFTKIYTKKYDEGSLIVYQVSG